eukprot:scaffold92780_cov33-Prasinocladus_malaysianus.AAC.1
MTKETNERASEGMQGSMDGWMERGGGGCRKPLGVQDIIRVIGLQVDQMYCKGNQCTIVKSSGAGEEQLGQTSTVARTTGRQFVSLILSDYGAQQGDWLQHELLQHQLQRLDHLLSQPFVRSEEAREWVNGINHPSACPLWTRSKSSQG